MRATAELMLPQKFKGFFEIIFKKDNQKFVINRTDSLGKVIFANISHSDTPIKKNENTILLLLPDSKHRKNSKYFCYFTKEGAESIINYLSAYFDLFFSAYCQNARKLRYPQKTYIQMFCELINDNDYRFSDALTKQDYRDRVNGAFDKRISKFFKTILLKI